MVVVRCCLDVIGDLCDGIAGFPEFEIDGLAVMIAVVLSSTAPTCLSSMLRPKLTRSIFAALRSYDFSWILSLLRAKLA